MYINTNIYSLTAQLNLSKSQSLLGQAIERLSSGKRINSAKDDAAGSGIANRFTSNIRGLNQALRNTNDGISLIQTTLGALDEVNNNLQRIRELSVQAANGTNSQADLDSIQAEVDQRLDEIVRIASQTSFNGVKTLSEDGKLRLQVGANDEDYIILDLFKMSLESLGLDTYNVNGKKLGSAGYTLLGVRPSEIPKAQLPQVSGNPGTINYVAVYGLGGEDFGLLPSSLGVVYNAIYEAEGKYYLGVNTPHITAASDAVKQSILDAKLELGTSYFIEIDPTEGVLNTNNATLEFDFSDRVFPLSAFSIDTTVSGSPYAPLEVSKISDIDTAINRIDELRGQLGAMQNRLESVTNTISTTAINLSAARSRIEDADYALEVSKMIRAQILQQAGVNMVAQANQIPNIILGLLR